MRRPTIYTVLTNREPEVPALPWKLVQKEPLANSALDLWGESSRRLDSHLKFHPPGSSAALNPKPPEP